MNDSQKGKDEEDKEMIEIDFCITLEILKKNNNDEYISKIEDKIYDVLDEYMPKESMASISYEQTEEGIINNEKRMP